MATGFARSGHPQGTRLGMEQGGWAREATFTSYVEAMDPMATQAVNKTDLILRPQRASAAWATRCCEQGASCNGRGAVPVAVGGPVGYRWSLT